EALDQRAETRTPGFYRRKLLIDALTLEERGPVPTQETILRAEAYLRDGTAEMTAITLAVSQRDWSELPTLVDRLLDSDFKPGPKQEAALELLGERLQSGTNATEEGVANSPRDAEWAFLSCVAASLVDGRVVLPAWFGPSAVRDASVLLRGGSKRAVKDPRDALVVYLMSSRPEWSPWVLPRIKELQRDTRSSLWPLWLRARVEESIGDRASSGRSIAELIGLHPLFGPAHDSAVELAKRAHPSEPLHRQIVRARRIRLQSLGEELIADPIEIRLARAGEFFRSEDYTSAIQELQPVVTSGGINATEGRLMLGMLMIQSEQFSVAADQLERALEQDAGIFEESVIDSLLYALTMAIKNARSQQPTPQRAPLSVDAALAKLSALRAKFPLDPRVALGELKLMVPEGKPDLGMLAGVARRMLNDLHRDSGRKPLDQLRRGSTRPWIEFLRDISPELAGEILARDLVLEPGNLDLWQLSGEVAETLGQYEEARGYYETLMKIDPRAETAFSLAEIIIREGEDTGAARQLLILASRMLLGGSDKANYLKTVVDLRDERLIRGSTNKAAPKLEEIVPRLKELWRTRQRIAKEVNSTDLGLLYADALFRRLAEIDFRAKDLANLTERKRANRKRADEDKKVEHDPNSKNNLDDLAKLEEQAPLSEAKYRATLSELLAFLPELVAHIERDRNALYELDLATALSGIADHIAAQGFKAPLLEDV
ncbi:MAG: tetratricopeptide (TPR) repeat protein, partial [Planctomycetota bacterium]